MTSINKVLLVIGSLIVAFCMVFTVYEHFELKAQNTAILNSIVAQQQLANGIIRASAQYATKDDIAKFASDNAVNLKTIQDNLDKLGNGAQVSSVNVFSAVSNGQNSNNLPSTNTGPVNPTPPTQDTNDPYGYQKFQQDFALSEDFGTIKVPFGTVGFSAWQKDAWNVNVLPRNYEVANVVGQDENSRQYFYNRFSVNVGGKSYDIPIKTSTTKQELPSAKFSWWNPRLVMGADVGVDVTHVKGEFSPTLQVAIMSYGQFKPTPDWSFLQVGAAWQTVSQKPAFVVTPFAYNVGKNMFSPLMSNTYIGPSVMLSTDGSFVVNGGIRVGF